MAIVQVGADGRAPITARVGDVVRTAGGDYKITGGKPGAWTSVKVGMSTSSSVKAKLDSRSSGSSGSSGSWQDNMKRIASGGTPSIQSEIERASGVLASGKATEATLRYISQMNALKDGASLTAVMAGNYDMYKRREITGGSVQSSVHELEDGSVFGGGGAYIPPKDDGVWTKKDELSYYPGNDSKGEVPYLQGLASTLSPGTGTVGNVADPLVMIGAGLLALVAVAKIFGK